MYKKITLDNGLRIIAHRMPDMQSLSLGIWIKAGGRYESLELKGISHFLEHLTFKGSKKYSCRKIKESIEGVGGSLNGFTSEELTCYLVKIPGRYLELATGVLSDMVINPLLSGVEIEKERTVILEEIKMYKDQPQSFVYELLDELLWPAQPLGIPIIGTTESIAKINRDSLKAFQQKFYIPSNIIVAATGNLDYKRLEKAVAKSFQKQESREKNIFVGVKEKQSLPRLKLLDKDTEQTHMALGFHSLPRDHSLKHALGLLHIILGANMSSRLFDEVREKRGLAYEIGTLLKRFQDTGAFIVHAGIDNKNVLQAIKLILKELKKIKEGPVTKDEFKRSKEFYVGQLELALEDTLDHMFWIGESTAALDKTYSFNDIIKEVNSVTENDILRAARHIFKGRKLNLALIGPLKARESDIYNELKID